MKEVSYQPLAAQLFISLHQMDTEAITVRNGSRTGLSWYGGHARPDLKKPRTEPEWSNRLAALLTDAGMPTNAEVAYPAKPRTRCDLVVQCDDASIWIEVKGAWRSYWAKQGGLWIYRSYLLHPLVGGLDASKTHTAPLDLAKLESLTPKDCDAVGLLLIGFDEPGDPMDADVADLEQRAGLHGDWSRFSHVWPDAHRPGYDVKAWFWCRAV